MQDANMVALIVALVGSGGLGSVIVAILNNVKLHKQGVAGKEDQRREDIVKQRDEALARLHDSEISERAEEARADAERIRRIRWQEEAARLRVQLIQNGQDPGGSPVDEATIDPRK